MSEDRRQPFLEVLGLVAIFLAAGAIVAPWSDIPLNDDWNFALAAWHFADTGEFRFSRFTGMSLRLQVLWGALWTWMFGQSYLVLRLSTVTLSVLTLVLLHRLLCALGVERRLRIAATAAFAFHPIFFWSSFTFMTQVPYLFLSVAAFWFFWRSMGGARMAAAAGSVAAAASYFIRQTGIASVIAPLIAADSESRKRIMPWSAAALGIFVALYVGTGILDGYPGQSAEHFRIWQSAPGDSAMAAAQVPYHYTVFNFENAFLFTLPLTFAAFGLPWSRLPRAWRLVLAGVSLPFVIRAFELIGSGHPIPWFRQRSWSGIFPGNVFTDFGLGPQTLPDIWTHGGSYTLVLPMAMRIALTVLGTAGGALLLFRYLFVFGESDRSPRSMALRLAAAHGLVATALLFISGIYFDRYALDSLWTVPVIAVLAWGEALRRRFAVVTVLLVAIALFSIGATQEYHSWQAARWQAVDWLRARNVALERIDAGYEVNQHLIGGFDGQVHLRKQGFSVVDDEYMIVFRPVAGYGTVASFPYQGWFGLNRDSVLIIRRKVEGGV
jgi:hypothetical protein